MVPAIIVIFGIATVISLLPLKVMFPVFAVLVTVSLVAAVILSIIGCGFQPMGWAFLLALIVFIAAVVIIFARKRRFAERA